VHRHSHPPPTQKTYARYTERKLVCVRVFVFVCKRTSISSTTSYRESIGKRKRERKRVCVCVCVCVCEREREKASVALGSPLPTPERGVGRGGLKEYRLFYRALLQKRPIILRSLLIVATFNP